MAFLKDEQRLVAWVDREFNCNGFVIQEMSILVNQQQGHDKVYLAFTSLNTKSNKYSVIGAWGKNGAYPLQHQVKASDIDRVAATSELSKLIRSKTVKGYSTVATGAKAKLARKEDVAFNREAVALVDRLLKAM